MTRTRRIVMVVIGLISLGLGLLGVVLPLLPTVPFILLAAFAFADSSESMHQWLLDHNLFGPMIENWRQYGSISRSAKITTAVSMIAILAISWWFDVPAWIIAVQAVILSGVLAYILSRPLPPQER